MQPPQSKPLYDVNALKIKNKSDRRREARRDYSGFIFFATDNHACEGVLKNFSRSGLHIQSDIGAAVGDRITIALPYLNDKRMGEIVWRSNDGFGVRLHNSPETVASASRLYHSISSRVIRLFRPSA